MKTPAEFEPIALWMGWEKDESGNLWVKEKTVARLVCKTSLTDAEAVSALNRLVEKGQHPLIAHAKDGWSIIINRHEQKRERKAGAIFGQSTISAAVEEALLRLIAAEGKEEE